MENKSGPWLLTADELRNALRPCPPHVPTEDGEQCSLGHADGKSCFRCRHCRAWIHEEYIWRPAPTIAAMPVATDPGLRCPHCDGGSVCRVAGKNTVYWCSECGIFEEETEGELAAMNRAMREQIAKRALVVELPPIGVKARLANGQAPELAGTVGKLDLRHFEGPKARLDLDNGMYVWAAVRDLVWDRK